MDPRIIENDKDYQRLEEYYKKQWLEKNPGKNFSSKEGLDYLYGSLEDENAPSLAKDVDIAFRSDPLLKDKLEKYIQEQKKVYDTPSEDPTLTRIARNVQDHIAQRDSLPKTNDSKSPEEIRGIIENREVSNIARNFPEKYQAYTQRPSQPQTFMGESQSEESRDDRKNQRQIDSRILQYPQTKPSVVTRPVSQSFQMGRSFGRGTINTTRGMFGFGGRMAGAGGRSAAIGGRLAAQGALAAGRLGVAAVGAVAPTIAAAFANPVGLIVLGVIIAIAVTVFLIVYFTGGSGSSPIPPEVVIDLTPTIGPGISPEARPSGVFGL